MGAERKGFGRIARGFMLSYLGWPDLRTVQGKVETMAKHILVIDDDRDLCGLICQTLKDKGYDVMQAADGREGLDMMGKVRFDLVITDIVMPRKEGIETIMEIKYQYPETRIIAISGAGERKHEFVNAADKLGADGTMVKPLDFKRLLEMISELVQGRGAVIEA